jgi:small subunit ribosomal protein S3
VGQKVNPYGLRLGINKSWKSKWYVDPREYASTLHEDLGLRKMIAEAEETQGADIADLEIIRHPQRITLIIHTGRPGVIIGAKGANIEKLGKKLQKLVGKKIQIKIKEIGRPETDAQLIAENVSRQLKSRASFRRAMKMAVGNAIKAGVQGAKIRVSGRLGGAEIARTEQYKEGRIPLHTFRADIDYGATTAITTFGCIGIKVWVYKGELFGGEKKEDAGLLLRKQRERERSRS